MSANTKYMTGSILVVILLCMAQIIGSTFLISIFLAFFLVLLCWSCSHNFTLPILLFFLPWSPILKISPSSYSFFTIGLVLVCGISIFKKQLFLKKYHITAGILLLFLSLLSKLLDGSSLSFSYVAFIMMIVVFPVVKEEWVEKKYNFYIIMSFFSMGIIIAALCAMRYATFPNIARYIRVDSYLTILRRSGFYGDANFYTAQITAALGGCVFLLIQEKKKSHLVFLSMLAFLLLYSGFLSGSKSFVLVSAAIFFFWIIEVLKVRGRTGRKIALLIGITVCGCFILTSALFSEQIQVLTTRFSYSKNLDSFTTGRIELWKSYLEELVRNIKVLFLGRGFTNIKVNGRGSHNTIIQIFYQFGTLGAPFLFYWITCFFSDANRSKKLILSAKILPVIVGVFLPWAAIDTLFFDDFFLMQWYVFIAIRQLEGSYNESLDGKKGNYI